MTGAGSASLIFRQILLGYATYHHTPQPHTPACPLSLWIVSEGLFGKDGGKKNILFNSCQNICIFGRVSFFLRLRVSEKLLEKLKISVKQEGNTAQPAVPSEQKARQPGCEVLSVCCKDPEGEVSSARCLRNKDTGR